MVCCLAFPIAAQQTKTASVLANIPSSIRGLSVVDDNVVWFSGSKGIVGKSLDGGKHWKYSSVKSFEKADFRSLYAFDSLTALIANAGSPGVILKTTDGGKSWREVYRNDHPNIFFDGIDFWDHRTGMIFGDPIDGKMVLLKTFDVGEVWRELAPDYRPSLDSGEAAFAASGTGIRCYTKERVAIATGGLVSRIWLSKNWGQNWSSMPAPIIQGKSSTGIFSIGMAGNNWVMVGGDFMADSISVQNAFYSADDGTTWLAPTTPTRGYRSCVEFISGTKWIAVGQKGIDLSQDNGKNWTPFSNEKGLHVIRKARSGKRIFAAGNGRIITIESN